MCTGVMVTQRVICTVTLTLVNCETNSSHEDVKKQLRATECVHLPGVSHYYSAAA